MNGSGVDFFCINEEMCDTAVDEEELSGSFSCVATTPEEDAYVYAGAKQVVASIAALGALVYSAF